MTPFDAITVVDWSARSKPSAARPEKDAIFWCRVDAGGVTQAYARTRAEARDRLVADIRADHAAARRALIGFDFPFGYPAGVAQHLTGSPSALALWNWLAERIEDASDNSNNRYTVAEDINRTYPGTGPAWGRPASWNHPDLPTKASARFGDHPPERRLADARAKGAKTVWQLAYAGSVGSQVLLGLPTLHEILRLTPAQVWPFHTGLTAPKNGITLAEIYPSLLMAEARADQSPNEPLDAAQVRVNARALWHLNTTKKLAPLFAPDLSADEARTVTEEEAWILGLGFEHALIEAARSFILPKKLPPEGRSTPRAEARP